MSIRRQSFWGILTKALNILLGFLVVAVLARTMSPTEYGIYSVILATVTVLTVPTALGLPNYVVRETARATGDHDGALVRRIVRSAGALVLVVSTLMLAASALWTQMSDSGTVYRATMWIGLWLIPVMALNQILGAALRGIGQGIRGLLLGLVLRPMLFFFLLIGWILLVGKPGSSTAMALHVLGAFLAFVFGVLSWIMFRPAKSASAQTDARINMKDMLVSTGVMGIIAGTQTLNANLDVMMLGALRGAETAGIYKLASTAALLTVAGLQAINMVLMPHFARVHREGTREQLQALATRSVRMILLTAVPSSLLLVVAGKQIIEIAFGAEYLASYTPMVILVVGQLVSALFGSVVTILNMTGHEKDTMKVVLMASVINIVLNAVLIPPYGAEGAAIATGSTVIFWNVILHIMIRRRLSINSTPFTK